MNYANGDKYVGEWKDSKKHGEGNITYSSGTKNVGVWQGGLFSGDYCRFDNFSNEYRVCKTLSGTDGCANWTFYEQCNPSNYWNKGSSKKRWSEPADLSGSDMNELFNIYQNVSGDEFDNILDVLGY
jgi:hypothetical protein